MAILKQSVSYLRAFFMVQSSDHHTPLTGATPTVNLSKHGGAFGGAFGPISEIGNGWYKITLGTLDVDTIGDLAYHITATSGDPTDFADQVVVQVFDDLDINPFGQANISSNIKQNQALNGFMFVMTDSTTHAPATGKTVTAQRALGGGLFAPCANSVTEMTNGIYTINLAAADLNSATVMLRFTATGCDDRDIEILTQP